MSLGSFFNSRGTFNSIQEVLFQKLEVCFVLGLFLILFFYFIPAVRNRITRFDLWFFLVLYMHILVGRCECSVYRSFQNFIAVLGIDNSQVMAAQPWNAIIPELYNGGFVQLGMYHELDIRLFKRWQELIYSYDHIQPIQSVQA